MLWPGIAPRARNRLPTSRRRTPSKPVVRFVAAVLTILALTPINAASRRPGSKNHRGGRDCRGRRGDSNRRRALGTELDRSRHHRGVSAARTVGRRARRRIRPMSGCVFDRDAIYVAVRAFDPEPDRIVGLLTRRDDSSPSDWISILIDSYHDHRTAYRVRRQPGGREVRSLLVQRQQHRPQLGRGVGCRGRRARTRGLAGGVPHPVLAAALQAVDDPDAIGFAVVRDGRARERNVDVAAARAEARAGTCRRSASCAASASRAATEEAGADAVRARRRWPPRRRAAAIRS